MQSATSECNMNYHTGRDDRCHATCNLQPCNTKMQQVRTPCNIKHTCIVRSTRCYMHHTPCNVQRTPCTVLMQHAQLSATRIAHRRRACDAAALEADRPARYYHHTTVTVLHTAAPIRLRPDRPPPATRTAADVLEIATDSNVALPPDMDSTPPPSLLCK
jgi:hypothetical protein